MNEETREALLFRLGRESAEWWCVYEQEELANLEWFRLLGDADLIQYTLGRLSTLDDESEVSR
jgi:hypothetical protein